MKLHIKSKNKLVGEITIPGDKSISHRALILGSLALGKTRVKGFLESEDCLRTLQAFKNMGVQIKKVLPGEYVIYGVGLDGLKESKQVLDCGNSGTTMRLLSGLLAPQRFYTVLTGDSSLRSRPMDRVIKPLAQMGAKIWGRRNCYAPLSIQGVNLSGIDYQLPVASAQVKSAILLAGLYTEEKITLTEPKPSRDHTERLLKTFGIDLVREGLIVSLPASANRQLQPRDISIPGDISSAAFFLAAGLIIPNSTLLLRNVGINPTRSGFLTVIKDMGGYLEILNHQEKSGEPLADILIKTSSLRGITIDSEMVPSLIDELPLIALLASQAEGETIIKDAAELRVKETDRIRATVSQLAELGVQIRELRDGMIIQGPTKLTGGKQVFSYGDHRIAMMLVIAGLLAEGGLTVNGTESIKTSFPQFSELLTNISEK